MQINVVMKTLVFGVLCAMALLQTVNAATQSGKPKKQKVAAQQKVVATAPEISTQQPTPEPPTKSIRAIARAAALAAAKAQAEAEAANQEQVQASLAILFNRTMRLPHTYNLPPTEDGIHDPTNEGINTLHAPLTIYADLPRNQAGNRINWVTALGEKKIAPRWDHSDAQAEGMVMDMDIIRIPRGSMPNVVFPHKQHTEWLACSNCHPAIFIPQKGANQINMRLILSGEKCGVCHGKVAFPPSECRLCHSQKKEVSSNKVGKS